MTGYEGRAVSLARHHPTTANGRYVELHITAIMCTVELCVLWFCKSVAVSSLLVLRVGRR